MMDGYYGNTLLSAESLAIVTGSLANDAYFAQLPEEIREQIHMHAGEFRNIDDLRRFVDDLQARR